MEKKYNYLYKITNLINNKFYYGIHSTDNLDDSYMGSGTCLNKAYEKYGIENFKKEILEFRDTRKEISDLEKEVVTEELIKNPDCYNISLGGDGWRTVGTATMKDKNGDIKRVVIGSNEYNNMTGATIGKVNVFDSFEKIYKSISKEEYYNNKDRYHAPAKGMVSVFDTFEKIYKSISKEEYYNNKDRYHTPTKGMVKTIKDGVYTMVTCEEYHKGGYVTDTTGRKHTKEDIQKIKDWHKNNPQIGEKNSMYGKCWITNGIINKPINQKELNDYINNGWYKGITCEKPVIDNIDILNLEKDIDKLSNKKICKKYNIGSTTLKTILKIYNLGKCWVHNDIEGIKIKRSELQLYINNGWVEGRFVDKCWVHNNEKNKFISVSELDKYLNGGWIKGRKMKF